MNLSQFELLYDGENDVDEFIRKFEWQMCLLNIKEEVQVKMIAMALKDKALDAFNTLSDAHKESLVEVKKKLREVCV